MQFKIPHDSRLGQYNTNRKIPEHVTFIHFFVGSEKDGHSWTD